MKYFGTSLTNHGHYIWEPEGNYLLNSSINLRSLPISPYDLPCGKNKNKGDVTYYFVSGYTICRIEGSVYDKRNGTMSVFYIEGEIPYADMKDKIMSVPITKKIIESMPFEINW